jgi:hypothetical protein
VRGSRTTPLGDTVMRAIARQTVVLSTLTQTVLALVTPGPGTNATPSESTQTLAVVPVVGVYTQVVASALPAGITTAAATPSVVRRTRDIYLLHLVRMIQTKR